jgi:hypothetical protein
VVRALLSALERVREALAEQGTRYFHTVQLQVHLQPTWYLQLASSGLLSTSCPPRGGCDRNSGRVLSVLQKFLDKKCHLPEVTVKRD